MELEQEIFKIKDLLLKASVGILEMQATMGTIIDLLSELVAKETPSK
jgi:hypothetical protein